jgi:hypothetical protein
MDTEFRLFIDGKNVDSVSGRTFESENPYTGAPWARIADGTPEDVDAAVAAARTAFDGEWGHLTGFQRAAIMRRCADALDANAGRLAQLEVNDSGKLMREMAGQMAGLSSWFNYFSGLADKLEGATVPLANPSYFAYTRKEPVGVVGAITPWNSPLLLLTWKLAPLLAAGNVCVAKPSEHSPASTVAFAQILHEAGLPAGVFNVVTGWDRSTGEALAGHPRHRQGGVHRIHRDRHRGGAGSHREREPGDPRAGREVRPDGVPGRRPGRRGQRDRRRRVRRHRADLHGRVTADRARVRGRRARREGGGPRGDDPAR